MLVGSVVGQEPFVLFALLLMIRAVSGFVRHLLTPLAQAEDCPVLTARVRRGFLVHADGARPCFSTLVGAMGLAIVAVRRRCLVGPAALDTLTTSAPPFVKLADTLLRFAKVNLAEDELLVALLMTSRARAKAVFDALTVISLPLLDRLLETRLAACAAGLRRVLTTPAALDRSFCHQTLTSYRTSRTPDGE